MARIVICESSVELRHLFAQTVARVGHEPAAYADPADAALRADAVLVDVDDEVSAAAALEIHAQAPGLPIIVCSIYPRDARADALDAPAHLVKPFSRPALDRAITTALRTSGTIDRCPPIPSAPTTASG